MKYEYFVNYDEIRDDLKDLKLDDTGDANEIFSRVVQRYKNDTSDTKHNYKYIKSMEKLNTDLDRQLSDNSVSLSELQNLNETKKRKIEINLNTSKRIENQIKYLKISLIIIGVLLLFPVLSKLGLFSKKIALMLWSVSLFILLIYLYVAIYVKDAHRDDIMFKEYNFQKPTDENVAKSKMLVEMSKRDKNRCQALQELEDDFDPSSLPIDVNEYLSKTDTSKESNTCSN